MKFLLLLFLIACSSPDYQNSEVPPAEDHDLGEISGSRVDEISGSKKNKKSQRVRVAKDENEGDKKINPLKDEEIYLTKQRRQEQKRLRGFASTSNQSTRAVHTICRRFDGCQRFCADWLDQNTHCNQWTINTVVQMWSSMLDSFSAEQLIQNAQWAAKHQDVSVFLREADFEQNVMDKIISRLSLESCPFNEGLDIYHSEDVENASLYLVHPEGREQGVKKITDPKHFDVDINAFKGSVNKCLDDKKLSLSELMLVHQNTLGFQLMHQKIANSCAHKEECIQLAYCKINSEPVWTHLEQVKDLDAFNIEVQADKCSYEHFNSLPSIEL